MKLYVTMIMLALSGAVTARYHVVRNASQLEKLVDSYEYSVVCFAPSGAAHDEQLDRDEKLERGKAYRDLQQVVRSTSTRNEYKKYASKDVGFIVVNTASDQAKNVTDQYHVTQQPICVVFEQGAVNQSYKVRPLAVRDLVKLLDQVGGKRLEKILELRRQEQELEKQERIAQYYAYGAAYPYTWGPGWYGGPYWGYGYGVRPYWGFYAGF